MEFAFFLVYLRTIVVIVSVPLFKGVLVLVVVPVNPCFRDLKNLAVHNLSVLIVELLSFFLFPHFEAFIGFLVGI